MKRYLILTSYLLLFYLKSNADEHYTALKSHPKKISDIRAEYLINHPGLKDTVYGNWKNQGTFEAAKLESAHFLWFPDLQRLYAVELKNVIWYDYGWHVDYIKVRVATDEAKVFVYGYYFLLLIIVGPMLYRWTRRLFSRDYVPEDDFDLPLKYVLYYFLGFMWLGILHMSMPHDSNLGSAPIFWTITLVALAILFDKIEEKSHDWM